MNPPAFKKIKSTVQGLMPDARILLFGSQVRGDTVSGSDYDVLVITKRTIPSSEKINWISRIHKALVYTLDAPVDVLLNSEDEVKIKKELPGHVVRWAVKERLEL